MSVIRDKDKILLTHDEIVMGFVASCVEAVAEKLDVDYLDVYIRMERVGLISDYIVPHYEVLHTESRENVTDGILNTLLRWEERR